ncbi:jacalin-related lectin 3 isoform X2 [Andrographis paniculata]|uniref:jacalin-related lectin 3 isoform X2 n=1 Tax=Andrographis paniculata TaxID=175694 RepID=UPI0021E997A0|nr:jacalin-related lectin 3 isoform X2 [Andrographis paniculata]
MSLDSFSTHTTLVGPWGGHDGSYWDDGVHSTIRQLEISHGTAVDSIRIEYDSNGRSVWSEKHGGNGGFTTNKKRMELFLMKGFWVSTVYQIKLDYPDEFLTSMRGHYGSMHEWGNGPVIIRSLTFESNKRTYGPYGAEHGAYFTVPRMSGKIVGFLGKSGSFLDAIGLYVEPIQSHVVSNSIFRSQQFSAQGTNERYEYSMIQGSLGPDYDLIVAVRQKDAWRSHQPNDPPKHTSNDFSLSDLNNENEKGVVMSYGPWGGSGGSMFDDGIYDGIRQIRISRNVGIVSIRVCYDQNGQSVWGSRNGGKGAFKSDKIILDYPSEVLTHVTGYYGPTIIMGPNVIKSLCFHTTKGYYGPYGEEEGEFFSTKLKEGSMVVGFHGRTGLFLDSIGVHVLEIKGKPTSSTSAAVVSPTSNPQMSAPSPFPKSGKQIAVSANKAENYQWPFKIGKKAQTEEVNQRLVKDPAPYGPGPWGGEGGKPWDDGVFTGIKQIILTKTDAVSCIEIEYDRSGQSVWSVKHGGATGETAHRIKLDYPHEVLTCISGYYGPVKNDQGKGARVIQSLSFHSSRKTYGPFGEQLGTYFESGTTQGKVVGFHGRSSVYLDAIGVHMQHWLGTHRSYKPQSIMKIFSKDP